MPIQMNEVVDRGINVAVSRRLGLADTSLSLLPELGINMLLPSEELLYHMGWRRYQRGFTQAAVAAVFSNAQIRNPAGSNILVIVERLLISVGTAGNVDCNTLGIAANLATSDLGAIVRDSRQLISNAVNPAGTALTSHESNAAAVTAQGMVMRMQANIEQEVPGGPWILKPGDGFIVGNGTPNDRMDGTWYWRERILNDQENVP